MYHFILDRHLENEDNVSGHTVSIENVDSFEDLSALPRELKAKVEFYDYQRNEKSQWFE